MPLYPSLARAARIQGEVKLRVATDGEKVTDVAVEKGPPMLARVARDNIKTWQFAKHPPTVFVTTFAFHLVEQSGCEPLNENGRIVLTLPAEVDITATAAFLGGCDPEAGLDLTEPLRVFLTRCEVDGISVPCEKIAIRLVDKRMEVRPERREDSDTIGR
jgi:hypothetical protein